MRRIWLVAALLCVAFPGTAAAKAKYPYVAYVSVERAALRSGPAEEHYATDRLERGTKLEVHRHDPGGWYAVRPLPGSYSWVPAKQVELTDEPDVAEVTKEGTVAWVGSREGQVKSLGWQIEFKKGDLVEVLGAKRMSLAEGEPEEICYKIAPPAGEFRWIHNRNVTRRGLDELAEEEPEVAPEENSKPAVQPATFLAPADGAADKPANAAPALKGDGFVPRKKRTETDPSATPASSGSPAIGITTSGPVTANLGETDYDARLREFDVELSLLVARDVSAWNLTSLRQRAAAHMDAGQTPLERGRARLLVEKIDEFAEFAKRRPITASASTASAVTETKATAKNPLDTTKSPVGSGVRGTEFAPDIDPRYDGIGWLMPVHSSTRTAPPYALQDNDGKVLQYITPAPGVNLNRYLRSQVGIYGQRGFVSHLKTPHLTAQRVISLERHKK